MPAPVADRDQLLDAACACFVRKGFARTTLDEIAAEADVSRATAFRHIGGKHAYVDAVFLREATLLVDSFTAQIPATKSVDELVRTLVRTAVETIRDRPVMWRAAGPDILEMLPRFTVEGWPLVVFLAQRLAEAFKPLRGGILPPMSDSEVLAFAEEAVRFVLCRVHTPTLDGAGMDPEAAADRAALLLVPAIVALFR